MVLVLVLKILLKSILPSLIIWDYKRKNEERACIQEVKERQDEEEEGTKCCDIECVLVVARGELSDSGWRDSACLHGVQC